MNDRFIKGLDMILPRQRNTKYHKRNYLYDVLWVSVFLVIFLSGVYTGWILGV